MGMVVTGRAAIWRVAASRVSGRTIVGFDLSLSRRMRCQQAMIQLIIHLCFKPTTEMRGNVPEIFDCGTLTFVLKNRLICWLLL